MTTFSDRVREARRLAILQLLAEAPGYEAADTLIYAALPDRGVAGSADQVASELAWLAEQGLAEVQKVGPVAIAKITQRGIDASRGRALVPGVARPGP